MATLAALLTIVNGRKGEVETLAADFKAFHSTSLAQDAKTIEAITATVQSMVSTVSDALAFVKSITPSTQAPSEPA